MPASIPARPHTKRGYAIARGTPFCRHEQPDPCCNCDACTAYWDAWEHHHEPSTDLSRAAS